MQQTTNVLPTYAEERATRCSYYDYFVRFMTPSLALCYGERLDRARMRAALARVLGSFGVFAGRLVQKPDGWEIRHGVGATFEVAESKQTSAELGRLAAARHSRLVCPEISPAAALRGKRSVFAARLTDTPDGCVLGVTWHHMLGDLQSALVFLRAWADAYRDQPFEPAFDLPDRDAYLSENLPDVADHDAQLFRLLSWREALYVAWLATTQGRRIDLPVSAAELQAIHASTGRDAFVTRSDTLCAHVFSMICRARGGEGNPQLAISVNLRPRFGLPPNLLGNILDTAVTNVQAPDDPSVVSSDLRSRIIALSSGPLAHHALMRFKAQQPSRSARARCVPSAFDPTRGNLIVTNWTKLGIYEVTFGAQPPLLVHCAPQETGIWGGLIFEGPAQAGITVRLWLPHALAERVAQEHARTALARPVEAHA